MDEADIAEEVAAMANNGIDERVGWTINGFDTGEIEVTTPDGEFFRLSVCRVPEGFDA